MHDSTQIDGGDLDRHITNIPDGIPRKRVAIVIKNWAK